MIKGGAVYILTNQSNTTLYTGVTSNIIKRLYEHRTGVFKYSFTSKYALNKLVYYEVFLRIEDAIAREKQIKAGSRLKKENLIISINPNWICTTQAFSRNDVRLIFTQRNNKTISYLVLC